MRVTKDPYTFYSFFIKVAKNELSNKNVKLFGSVQNIKYF